MDTERKLVVKLNKPVAIAVAVVGLVLVLALAGYAFKIIEDRREEQDLARARSLLDRDFCVLAGEILEPRREKLVRSVKGCDLLIEDYLNCRQVAELEWAVESCIDLGSKSLMVHRGKAQVQRVLGDYEAALQTLKNAAYIYKNSEIAVQVGNVLLRDLHRPHQAIAFMKSFLGTVPSDAGALMFLVQVYREAGDNMSAAYYAQQLLPQSAKIKNADDLQLINDLFMDVKDKAAVERLAGMGQRFKSPTAIPAFEKDMRPRLDLGKSADLKPDEAAAPSGQPKM